MKIFILEDNTIRIETFKKLATKTWDASNLKIFIATDVEEGKIILKNNQPFDLAFLDHDLGGEIYVPSENENTGYQLAKFIEKENIKIDTIVIHSHNPSGAKNMNDILSNSHVIQFSYLIEHWSELFKGE
ncbi:MAG: response regulator [Candidatus Nanoarchaeia archaeon]|nr:response regulator [Candidatus Nanoarchaeia archaeon]